MSSLKMLIVGALILMVSLQSSLAFSVFDVGDAYLSFLKGTIHFITGNVVLGGGNTQEPGSPPGGTGGSSTGGHVESYGRNCFDNDLDGYVGKTTACPTGPDCDDTKASINPSKQEMCNDNIDNDCDLIVNEGCCFDKDKDGVTTCQGDCNDQDASIYAGAVDGCDNKDNDCDTFRDEDCYPAPGCGNNLLEGIEECDDGNFYDGDGCASTCALEFSGSSNDVPIIIGGIQQPQDDEQEPEINTDAEATPVGLTPEAAKVLTFFIAARTRIDRVINAQDTLMKFYSGANLPTVAQQFGNEKVTMQVLQQKIDAEITEIQQGNYNPVEIAALISEADAMIRIVAGG